VTVTGPKVVVVGDIACVPGATTTTSRCRQRATARLAAKLKPKRVIAVGDLQYENGELAHFQSSYDESWGALKRITRPLPGNHEYNTAGATGFYDYFGLTAPGYRTITVGTWRIYLLNSQCSQIDCAAERDWLRADLDANPTTCSAIAMHYPRYSSGEHGSNATVSGFWRIAYRHGVDLALAGHDHDYERFAAMNGSGKLRKDGLRSFVVGTGGKSLYSKTSSAKGSRYFRADKFGVLLMTLGDGAYSWRFRALGGAVRDAGSARCH
jgi:3',5'-cyclic AMP phosphodiesterase CpdA